METTLFSQIDIYQNLDFALRLIVACVCGAAIGSERSRRFKSAGVRTHIIVCFAAALMMVISKYAFLDSMIPMEEFAGYTRNTDPARVAAQVISGISFLGAGIIVKHGSSVKGLTTAAGIWATAGIGLAIGAGMYVIGIFATIVMVIIQHLMHKIKFGNDGINEAYLNFFVEKDRQFNDDFLKKMSEWDTTFEELEILEDDPEVYQYKAVVRMSSNVSMDDMIHYLSQDHRVKRFSVLSDVPN